MDPQRRLLEKLQTELRGRGLPRAQIARLVEELADHLEDLNKEKEHAMRTDVNGAACWQERLGTADELAEAAVANHQRARFAGRHPLVTFLLAPIPLFVVAWVGFMFLGITAARCAPLVLGDAYEVTGKPVGQWPAVLVWGAFAMDCASRLVPQMLVGGLLCYLALRSGRGWRWGMLGCGLVALIAGLTFIQLDLPVEPGNGQLSVGLAMPPRDLWQLAQCAPPLAAGLFVVWRCSGKPAQHDLPVSVA